MGDCELACRDDTSEQLDLIRHREMDKRESFFVFWFNMHKFDRGLREGKSPYEIAGIDLL